MNGLDQKRNEERKQPEFTTWLLSLPPINLYNVELVYLAFGYDQRWDMRVAERNLRKEKYWEE